MIFRTENDLEKAAIKFLKKMYFKFSWQVPIYNRMIDLAAVDQKGYLFGIEFKLRNWKQAIKQAKANLNSFDFVYVCLPGGKYLEELKKEAEELGIGVMIYDAKIKTIKIEVNAKKVLQQWSPNIKYLKDYLESRGKN